MREILGALICVLIGCSGSQRGARGTPEELGCTQDPAARTACDAQGDGYVYAAEPGLNCSGGNDSGKPAATHTDPCACMKTADYNERQHQCVIMQ